jgi:arylsulfatase
MAVYAAQVDRMDRSIGLILDALRDSGAEKDTLVLFLADNGGCAEFLREEWGGDLVVPTTRDSRPVTIGNHRDVMPGGEDTYMSYDRAWANASNTPFRLFKSWVHEGGISTPFVARWPRAIPAGGIGREPCNVVDVMATCLDAAGVPYPQELDDRPRTPTEGESLLPLLRGDNWARARPVFWEHEGNRAVRVGRWKLVSRFPNDWELYDIDADRADLVDVSGREPELVRELAHEHAVWAERCGVLPWQDVLARSIRALGERDEEAARAIVREWAELKDDTQYATS